jgi:hypothetical protein
VGLLSFLRTFDLSHKYEEVLNTRSCQSDSPYLHPTQRQARVLKCCCGDIVAVLLFCECELSIYHHVTIVQICNVIFAFLCQMTLQTADLPGLVY